MTARYSLEFTASAQRQLRKLDPPARTRIRAATDALCGDPRPPGVRAMVGSPGLLRVRVGDHRVIYHVEDEKLVVLVVQVGHRREVYG